MNNKKIESMNYQLFETRTYRITRRLISTNKNLLEIKHINKYGGVKEKFFNSSYKHIMVSEKLIKCFKYRVLLSTLMEISIVEKSEM